jgi:hypothetical protein
MAQQDQDGFRHEVPGDGDPLLVRPFLAGSPATPPSQARWPAQKHRVLRSHRGAGAGSVPPMLEPAESEGVWSPDGPGQGRRRLRVPSQATGNPPASSGNPPAPSGNPPAHHGNPPGRGGNPPGRSGERRRRSYALAGAGAAAVIGLAALGYGLAPPLADNEASLPAGALPPPAPAVTGPGGVPGAPDPGNPTATGTTGPAGAGPTGIGTGAGTTGPAAGRGGLTRPAGGVLAPSGSAPAPADATTGPPPPNGLAPTVAALSPAPEAARTGRIAAADDLCLDVNGGVPADNNHVQVSDCNGTSAQRWTMAPDGTLQVVGKCAQVTGDATVHIIGCDDREAAQWRAGPEDSLVNLATNECLTDPANGDRSGAAVVVTACSGSDNQQWDLP